jgi:sulfide:quinone oxidoreductase
MAFAEPMTKSLVILGGGTAGTLAANKLRRRFGRDDLRITVVDQDDRHWYQPGLLFVPFGGTETGSLVRPRGRQLLPGIGYRICAVDSVEVASDTVRLADGTSLPYDVLVVATGAVLAPQETEGLLGPGWMERVFTFYEPVGAAALARALETFESGRIVVNVVDMPIKCPVAPLEFCFLADDFFRRRGRRGAVTLTYVTPLDAAFTKPVAAATLGGMLADRGIELVTDFATGEVDGAGGRLVSYDGREVPFDLAVVVPAHAGAPYVGRSPGLGDALGFVRTDPHTLQAHAAPNVFAIGDATDLTASKAGSVAHFEGEVLVDNVAAYLAGEPLPAAFDGHANCFVETGDARALLVDFNYDVEPVPGHYPARLGLPLLKESRINHLGKKAFQWFYWHVLLPGRRVPGIGARMPTSGKRLDRVTEPEGAKR